MISHFFTVVFYQPLYNGLIFIIGLSPWIDIGVAIIAFTIIVRLLLFPLSRKAVQTQLKMKEIDPEIKALREKFKDNKEEQARRTMALYKEKGVNPFSGILLLFIQLPIILALYRVFYAGGLPVVNTALLYSFINAPLVVSVHFLGLIDVTMRNAPLALIAAITQYFQVRFSMPVQAKSETPSFSNDLARSMSLQMRYIFPIIVFFIAYKISAAIAIYWITSNVFTIGQELYIRSKHKPVKVATV